MRTTSLTLTFPLLIILIACGQTVSGPFIEPDETWPEKCRIQSNFAEGFPTEAVYPTSVPLDAVQFSTTADGFLGNFCTRGSVDDLVAWYRRKYEPQGYEYFNDDEFPIHYWRKNNQDVFLDIAKDYGGYVRYSVDVRTNAQ